LLPFALCSLGSSNPSTCGRRHGNAKRIAIIEDEAAIRDNYSAAFRREGYAVDAFDAREPALIAFDNRLPDLVVIDVNLRDDVEGGFELCRELRARSADLPIIFLTARDSEFDAVSGLRLGADDYLTKDISLPHLMARVAALFRRLEAMKKPQVADSRMARGDLTIDTERMTVHWQETTVSLTLTEFWLVHAVMSKTANNSWMLHRPFSTTTPSRRTSNAFAANSSL